MLYSIIFFVLFDISKINNKFNLLSNLVQYPMRLSSDSMDWTPPRLSTVLQSSVNQNPQETPSSLPHPLTTLLLFGNVKA